jgi:hypothetical protein
MTFQSVTFNSSGQAVDTSLESHVRPNNVLPDSQKANVNIQTRVGTLATYNTGAGPATQRVNVTQVQLQAPTGLVKVLGYDVKPEVAEKMRETSPEAFIEPEAKAAEEAKAALAADEARSEEVTREDLNRHPGEIEGYHQHLTGEVSQQNLIGLMVYGQKGEAPPADLLKTVAQEMGESLDRAIDKINLVAQGVQAQFTVLARSMGLDADKAADWLRDHRKDTSMVASQAHFMRRDLMAWKPLLEDYRAATGDGRKH